MILICKLIKRIVGIWNASEIKPEALLLPLSRGYGDVKSLHFAASENATLLTQLKEIANLPISSLDSYYAKLQTMVYNWTGANNVATNPIYGQYVDTQHLFVVERFAGIGTGAYATQIETNFVVSSLSFRWNEGNDRENGYEDLISELAVRFAAQGALKNIFGNPIYDFSTDKMVFSIPLAQIITNAKANVPTDSVDKNVYWSEVARTLKLYARDFGSNEASVKTQVDTAAGYNVIINNLGGRYFEGDNGNNILTGNALTNYLLGGNGSDTLTGGKGDDYLEGGDGNDIIRGDAGKDSLRGGNGSDILTFTNIADNQAANADYINDFVRGTDKIDVRGLSFARLDTDGGLTEANELRVTKDAGGTQTFFSDQNGFTFKLFSFATFTDGDFIWA